MEKGNEIHDDKKCFDCVKASLDITLEFMKMNTNKTNNDNVIIYHGC